MAKYKITDKPKHISPQYIGDREIFTIYERVEYSESTFNRYMVEGINRIDGVNQWLIIKGLSGNIQETITKFDIGNIALTDILDMTERPHLLTCNIGLGITGLYYNLELCPKRLSFWTNGVETISFQETHDNLFAPIFSRLSDTKSLTRKEPGDRLFVVLLDFLVDLYYGTLDVLEERINKLENEIFVATDTDRLIRSCHQLKQKVTEIQMGIKPLSEMLDILIDDNTDFFSARSLEYLKDVYNHCNQIQDKLEQHKSNLNSLVDLCIAFTSNRMNDVMKFLTVLSTYFLPLTFLTGLWGMNFLEPEIKWEYGYFFAWSVFLLIIGGMTYWFKRKNWL